MTVDQQIERAVKERIAQIEKDNAEKQAALQACQQQITELQTLLSGKNGTNKKTAKLEKVVEHTKKIDAEERIVYEESKAV